MDGDRLQKAEELFHAALLLSINERNQLLSEASQSDPDIVDEVRSLLLAYEQAGSFLDANPIFIDSAIGAPYTSLSGQEVGHFKILSLLGKGGMGEVYLAEDTKLRRKVAIKAFSAETIKKDQANKRLMREARAAANLDHPNICSVYEMREEQGRVLMIMQYIEGEPLSSKIENKALNLRESLDIAIQIADALSEAHRHGIIHRDIKPQNVILTSQGQVKVLDFGLAKILTPYQSTGDERMSGSLITEENVIMGTPIYMSPEQAKGEYVDYRSDLFSLGSLLFECVTGCQPFSGGSIAEIFANILHSNPRPASTFNPIIPPQLDAVLSKALAKEASQRYASASEMLTELRSIRGSLATNVQAVLMPPQTPSGKLQEMVSTISSNLRRSNYLKITATVLTVILLSFLLITFYFRSDSHNQISSEAKQWYEQGMNDMRWESYYQATRALERAVKLDSNFALSHARLAEAWSELDYTEKAKNELLLATSMIRNRESLSNMDSLYIDALIATSQRNFAGAVEIYKQIAELAADSEKQRAYLDLGRAHEKNEDHEKALESYLQSIKYDPRYAPAFLRLGRLYSQNQDIKNAFHSYDEAEEIYQDTGNQEGVVTALYYRGALFNSIEKTTEARANLEKALKIAELLTSKHQQIKTMLELSSVSYTEGNSAQAQEYATQAITLARQDNLENLTAGGLIELGNTYFIRGEYEEAKKYFKQASEFAGQAKGRHNEARALLSLGSVFIQLNSTDEGLPLVKQSMEFYEQGGYRQEALQALFLLARCYSQKGDYDEALSAYQQQLYLAEQMADRAQMAFAHIGMGSLLGFLKERYPEALTHFNESYKINTSMGAKLKAGYDLASQGSALWPIGNYDEAEAAFNQAYSIAQNPDNTDKYLTAWICLFKARMALSKGRLDIAKEKGRQALDLSKIQFRDITVQAKFILGLAEALSGQSAKGKALGEEARVEAANLNNPRYTSEATLFLAEISLASGDFHNALERALDAQASFALFGQQASEWQAFTIAAQSAYHQGNRQAAKEYASAAADLLSQLEQRWGEAAYNGFLMRPDVQKRRKQIDQLLATD